MTEVATKIDFNFSNVGGSAQKATVQTSLNAYNFDGTPKTDGIVVSGSNGQKITIGNPAIQDLLSNFSITEITESQDAISKTKSYKLQDNLSLELESRVVLLRGEQTGPKGEFDYGDFIYNWSEVPDNIKYNRNTRPYGKQAPIIDGRVIILGDLYNEIGLEDVKGESYSRVYLGGIEYPKFEQPPNNNYWLINYNFPFGGTFEDDRGSWQDSTLRVGYTLNDLKAALDLAGISHQGIPSNNDYLMEENGTLKTILNNAANKIGYYWYINPITETVVWVNSNNIDSYVVNSYIDTTDPKIISSSYTESVIKPAKVLAYNGNINQQKPKDAQKTQKERKLLKPFKRLDFSERLDNVFEYMMGIYYIFWNKDVLDQDVFDKIWFYSMHKSNTFRSAANALGYTDELENEMSLDEGASADVTSKIGRDPLNFEKVYDSYNSLSSKERNSKGSKHWNLITNWAQVKQFIPDTQQEKGKKALYRFGYSNQKAGALPNLNLEKSIETPSESYFFELINLFFDSAFGGIYVSSPISNYRAERIVFNEQGKYRVLGIYRSDTLLADIDELRALGDFLQTFASEGNLLTVGKIVKRFYPQYNTRGRYFAFATKQVPKQFIKHDALDVKKAVLDKYNAKIVEDKSNIKWMLVKDGTLIESAIQESQELYNDQRNNIVPDDTITIPYEKRRHPVADEEAQNEDDNDVPTVSNTQDLDFNRDYKIFKVEQPTGLTSLNPLSLENYSGNNRKEIDALLSVRSNSLNPIERKSSNRTVYDLLIPPFSPVLSSISISFGSDGIKTSITESNLDILPLDDQMIIDKYKQARTITSTFTRVNAARKNALGL